MILEILTHERDAEETKTYPEGEKMREEEGDLIYTA